MPLPTVGSTVGKPSPDGLAVALLNHPPVTGGNEIHEAKEGHCTFVANDMQIAAGGLVNYCYIPAHVGKVSFGVVDCTAAGDFYVISDQYGGCEYHELYNAQYNMLAFLHIYRGDGATVSYTPAAGWVSRSEKRSAVIAVREGMTGSNWSVSLVNRGVNPPTVDSKFIHVRNPPFDPTRGGYVGNFTVTSEDPGDTSYTMQAVSGFVRSLIPFGWT
jgi:hypothetical protein